MYRTMIAGLFGCTLLLCGAAAAQEDEQDVPPQNTLRLSEIIAKVEQRDAFQYIDRIEWKADGHYRVVYFTSDKAKVEINYNPVTGEPI